MIAIVDYGVGNLFSVQSSFAAIGAEAVVTSDPDVIRAADRILLRDAAQKLREIGMGDLVREQAASGKPVMGICLGMQLLFEKSYEFGEYEGLGLIKGAVRPIRDVAPADYKVPHIGWNALNLQKSHPLLKYVLEGDCVYFVHSFYAADCDDAVIATTEYGAPITAAVAQGNVCGCQFHPEKSGTVGLSILKAFCEL